VLRSIGLQVSNIVTWLKNGVRYDFFLLLFIFCFAAKKQIKVCVWQKAAKRALKRILKLKNVLR
jgi:hypothetical protein